MGWDSRDRSETPSSSSLGEWYSGDGSQTPSLPSQGPLESPIFTDSVVFRVAPWIMTPNTQQPLEVFVCRWVPGAPSLPAAGSAPKSRFSRFSPSVDDNEGFVAAVGALAERAQCPLTVCPAPQNRQDRWIQVGAGRARPLSAAAAPEGFPKFSFPSPG